MPQFPLGAVEGEGEVHAVLAGQVCRRRARVVVRHNHVEVVPAQVIRRSPDGPRTWIPPVDRVILRTSHALVHLARVEKLPEHLEHRRGVGPRAENHHAVLLHVAGTRPWGSVVAHPEVHGALSEARYLGDVHSCSGQSVGGCVCEDVACPVSVHAHRGGGRSRGDARHTRDNESRERCGPHEWSQHERDDTA